MLWVRNKGRAKKYFFCFSPVADSLDIIFPLSSLSDECLDISVFGMVVFLIVLMVLPVLFWAVMSRRRLASQLADLRKPPSPNSTRQVWQYMGARLYQHFSDSPFFLYS